MRFTFFAYLASGNIAGIRVQITASELGFCASTVRRGAGACMMLGFIAAFSSTVDSGAVA